MTEIVVRYDCGNDYCRCTGAHKTKAAAERCKGKVKPYEMYKCTSCGEIFRYKWMADDCCKGVEDGKLP